jgi:Uma2 family endonuclease
MTGSTGVIEAPVATSVEHHSKSPAGKAEVRAWPPKPGEWTYEDYVRLPNDRWRYEIIKGELRMAPAPRTRHQKVGFRLKLALGAFVYSHNLGEVYDAPTDVILPDLATPVQPDILFIAQARLDIVQDKFIVGPPDLIIEILSPSNWLDDRRDKYEVYEAAGVREYWIVDPDLCTVEVFVLRDERYVQVGRYGMDDVVHADVVAGFTVTIRTVCE